MVYNNPATANVDLMPALVARLAQIANCRYIKELTLEPTRVRDIIHLCGDRMTVFAGILGYVPSGSAPRAGSRSAPTSIPRWSARAVRTRRRQARPGPPLALYGR